MTGSIFDADDALQDGLLRAWVGLDRFDGRARFSTWLHRIVTNSSLTLIDRRGRRSLPAEEGFSSDDPAAAAGAPLPETTWVEPFPEDAYEKRETLELAYVAALQHLPPNGRAALMLTEVLGYSAADAAVMLGTTTASLNSALQRARRAIAERVPPVTQAATLRALGDARLRARVDRFVAAMDAADVDGVVELLTEDAAWSMPPQPAWFRGHAAIGAFLAENPFKWFQWRRRAIVACGQPATAAWTWDGEVFRAHAIEVLSFAGDRINDVTTFLDVSRRGVDGFPAFAAPGGLFERLGLEPVLDR
jgi:RNA polymerase sigma-70 factor (ECF subfamily)